MRNIFLACVLFALWMLCMWLVRLMDALDARNYLLLWLCLIVPGIPVVWLGGLMLTMFGLLPALAIVPLAALGGLAIVNSTSEEGQRHLEMMAGNPR